MLVLTRKRGESIVIGDDVEIRVLAIRGQKVRLAIDAPASLAVNRKEVLGTSRVRTWNAQRQSKAALLGALAPNQRVG